MAPIVTPDGIRLHMDIGTRVQCRWRDGSLYPVRVIERRPAGDTKGVPIPEEYEYYVHYEQFNRRLGACFPFATLRPPERPDYPSLFTHKRHDRLTLSC